MPHSDPRVVLRGLVGQRVVVRYRPDEGERYLTDVLGTLAAMGEGTLSVVSDTDGITVEVPLAAVVAGKAVPPRPPRRPR